MRGAEELPVSVTMWWFLSKAIVDSALLDALEQFKDQATDKLLFSVLEGCEDPGTTK